MNPQQKYNEAVKEYQAVVKQGDAVTEAAGKRLREAALERADRREWAHKRRGDEARWQE